MSVRELYRFDAKLKVRGFPWQRTVDSTPLQTHDPRLQSRHDVGNVIQGV